MRASVLVVAFLVAGCTAPVDVPEQSDAVVEVEPESFLFDQGTRFDWQSGELERTALQFRWTSESCDVAPRIATVGHVADEPAHGFVLEGADDATWFASTREPIAGAHGPYLPPSGYSSNESFQFTGRGGSVDASQGAVLTVFSYHPSPWENYDFGFNITIDCDRAITGMTYAAGDFHAFSNQARGRGAGAQVLGLGATVGDSASFPLMNESWAFAGMPAGFLGTLSIDDDTSRSWTLGTKQAESWTTSAHGVDIKLDHAATTYESLVVLYAELEPIDHLDQLPTIAADS